jgi:hypothetical protein
LTNHKELQKFWSFASHCETEQDLKDNKFLHSHAQNFVNYLTKAIDTVVSQKDLNNEDMFLIGKSHYGYGVKAEYFKVSLI